MRTYDPGEVVLVSFPFADLVGTKRRPALVLVDTGDDDVIVARVTSERVQSGYDVELTDWQEAGLVLPSVARLHKLATLEKRLIERRMGRLSEGDMTRVQQGMRALWEPWAGEA